MEDRGRQPFPDVPEDVVRLIFEVATETDYTDCRLEFALISKQVKGWVEPIIYREVEVSSFFHRTIMASDSTKPPDFFARHVKSLMFEMQEDSLVADILERCTSVQSLAVWYNTNPIATYARKALTTYPLSPTHLSLSQIHFKDKDAFLYPIFENVTHLDLSCPDSENDWNWGTLGVLEHLTHLSIDVYARPDDPIRMAENILSSSRQTLRAFKSLAGGDIDPRVVVAPYSAVWTDIDQRFGMTLVYTELFRSWTIPSQGNTLWTRAEQIVRERPQQTDSELASKLSHLTVEERQGPGDDQWKAHQCEVKV
ncbi:hypothetical protein FA13DRAFT_1725871 [Coprinellus micaceus]|uniref:F-box domain-containing protein n=1 Tax=Coprinellus micaceus TaxID=71717 RepID=A0A4Y7TWG1_COPMI|nr:hypothetical protein FA13DRAFT_1725871 [Coprinellus micaceus]